VLPQLWLMRKMHEVEAMTSHYVGLVVIARFIRMLFWGKMYFLGEHFLQELGFQCYVVNDWGEGSSRPRSSALGGRLTDEQFSSEIFCDSEVHAKFSKPELVSENPLDFVIWHYAGEIT
jgi:hypothetical protein